MLEQLCQPFEYLLCANHKIVCFFHSRNGQQQFRITSFYIELICLSQKVFLFFGSLQAGLFSKSYKIMNRRGDIIDLTAYMGLQNLFKSKMDKNETMPGTVSANQFQTNLPIFPCAAAPIFNLLLDVYHICFADKDFKILFFSSYLMYRHPMHILCRFHD